MSMASVSTTSNNKKMMTSSEVSKELMDTVRKYNTFLGGSSMGKGLSKATNYFIGRHRVNNESIKPDYYHLEGAADLDMKELPAEDSFYVCDIGVVMSQFWQWKKFFPRVEPFYAVKCNPDPMVIRVLAILGANFDCASRSEFRLVQDICKDLPRKPEIIYANPCKSRTHLIEAVCKGVKIVTFDNAAEVAKCAAVSTKIQLVLRIITDDTGSQCRLSTKVRNRHMTLPTFFIYLFFNENTIVCLFLTKISLHVCFKTCFIIFKKLLVYCYSLVHQDKSGDHCWQQQNDMDYK